MATIIVAILNEARKGFLILWAYRINILISMIAISITFIGIGFLLGDGTLEPQLLASALLGYVIWYYVLLLTGDMGENLVAEAAAGSLEQMFISPVPISLILIGRTLANLISSTIQILLVAGVIIVLMKIPLQWHWEALPVIAITMLGLFGFGFMLGGTVLLFKQAHSVASLTNNVLIFLNGALVPINKFPDWLAFIAKLLPSTLGIVVIRSVLLDGKSLMDVWQDGSLPLLIIHSSVYIVCGWAVLQLCMRAAKRQGTLGQY